MAKRQPAAAISQNQNGREMIEEPDEPDEPDEPPELDGEEPELVPEGEEPEEPVAEEEPGEGVVRKGTVVVSVTVMREEGRGISELGGTIKEEEARVKDGDEDPSLVLGLEEVPVCEGLELDNESLGLELETLETDADGDEPEVAVAVAANAMALDAAALSFELVDVTFKLKLVAENVTLLVACHVSDPN